MSHFGLNSLPTSTYFKCNFCKRFQHFWFSFSAQSVREASDRPQPHSAAWQCLEWREEQRVPLHVLRPPQSLGLNRMETASDYMRRWNWDSLSHLSSIVNQSRREKKWESRTFHNTFRGMFVDWRLFFFVVSLLRSQIKLIPKKQSSHWLI